MLRRWTLALFWLLSLVGGARGASVDLGKYAALDAAPVSTSVYLGTVSLTAGRFVRHQGTYFAGYFAKVFPLFFYNETGELRVDVPDDALRRLAGGAAIDFTGRAIRTDGRVRPLSGRATPLDAASGTLKVRITVNKYVVLVFNTSYRLAPQAQ